MAVATPYKLSGAIGSAPVPALLLGLISACVFGYAYAYANLYSPLAGMSTFITLLLFALALGLATGFGARMGKCRNPGALALLSLIVGVAGLYVSWGVFIYAFLQRGTEMEELTLFNVLGTPSLIWDVAKSIAEVGWFSIQGGTPSGIVLWGLWALEAVLLLGLTVAFGQIPLNDAVFCETCGQWAESCPPALLDLRAESVSASDAADIAVLEALQPLATPQKLHLRVEPMTCVTCEGTTTYMVKRVSYAPDDKGTVRETSTDLTKQMLVDPQDRMRLLALSGRKPQPPVPHADAPPASEGAPAA